MIKLSTRIHKIYKVTGLRFFLSLHKSFFNKKQYNIKLNDRNYKING